MTQSTASDTQKANVASQPWVKEDGHLDHVEALARQLVRHLGESGARKTCQDNHWSGVLAVIDQLR